MITFAFDLRTAFLISGLLYLLLPTVAWILLAGWHSRQTTLWCGGGLLVGGSIITAGMGGLAPLWVSISLPSLMLLVSHFVRIHSLRMDMGIPWRKRWMLLAIIIIFLIFEIIHYGFKDYILRAQFNFSVGASLLLYLATLAWRIGRVEQSPSAKWIAWVYGLLACTMLYRVYALPGTGSVNNMMTEGLSSQLIAVAALLSNVIGHLGYIGLALDRSMRRELRMVADMTREEERYRLGQQIAQLDRQRCLGELSASLGHELNQPLTAILSNAQVSKRGLQIGHFDAHQLTDLMDRIIHNTQRASKIIERIRDYIRPAASRSEPVDVSLLALEVAELIGDEARKHKVTFKFFPSAGSALVMGDPILLSQIILNVFRNSIDALTEAARREIEVSCRRAEDRVILQIRDSGPGLTPETLAQIGTPFFTSKTTGLGMGISISRSIAAQHGGTLTFADADANNGSGAIIELSLPALPESKP